MTIDFYTIKDDPRVIVKSLPSTPSYSTDANILGNCSIKNPTLVLTYNSALLGVNYMHISDWHRYYFMGEPVVSPGGRCIITATEDVLFTNKDEILKLDAYCNRCENHFERYAIDTAVPSLVTTNVTNIPFSFHPFAAGTGQYQFLLTVKGGKMS